MKARTAPDTLGPWPVPDGPFHESIHDENLQILNQCEYAQQNPQETSSGEHEYQNPFGCKCIQKLLTYLYIEFFYLR